MKELQQHTTLAIEVQKQQPTQKVKLGSLKLLPGQKCWQFNTKTGEISEAEYATVNVELSTVLLHKIRRTIQVKEHCLYTVAINKNNAQKKFLRIYKVKQA